MQFLVIKNMLAHNKLQHILSILYFSPLTSQDRQLKIKDLVLSTHERAVRNCPWTMSLWKNYVLALERHGADHHTVSGNGPYLTKAPLLISFEHFGNICLTYSWT